MKFKAGKEILKKRRWKIRSLNARWQSGEIGDKNSKKINSEDPRRTESKVSQYPKDLSKMIVTIIHQKFALRRHSTRGLKHAQMNYQVIILAVELDFNLVELDQAELAEKGSRVKFPW